MVKRDRMKIFKVTVEYHITKRVVTYDYTNQFDRALALIALSPYADVVRLWEI